MEDIATEQRRGSLTNGIFPEDNHKIVGDVQRRQSLDNSGNIEQKGWSKDNRSERYSPSPLSSDMETNDTGSDGGLEDDEETGLTGYNKRKRRRRKRRNTKLDERVAETKVTREEEKIATQSLLRALLINAVLIGLW